MQQRPWRRENSRFVWFHLHSRFNLAAIFNLTSRLSVGKTSERFLILFSSTRDTQGFPFSLVRKNLAHSVINGWVKRRPTKATHRFTSRNRLFCLRRAHTFMETPP